jgi:hypothetical protein
MPTNTPDQGLTLPIDGDAADNPVAFTSYTGGVEGRLLRRYLNLADRTARDLAPVENQATALAAEDRIDVYDGANYVSLHQRSFFASLRKSADETINNVGVDQADDHLTVAVAANSGTYGFRLTFFYSSSTTAKLRCRMNAPALAVGRIGALGLASTAGATAADVVAASVTIESATDLTLGSAGVGVVVMAILEGEVTLGANAGNLTFNWAQNTADPTNTVMYARSRMHVWRIL